MAPKLFAWLVAAAALCAAACGASAAGAGDRGAMYDLRADAAPAVSAARAGCGELERGACGIATGCAWCAAHAEGGLASGNGVCHAEDARMALPAAAFECDPAPAPAGDGKCADIKKEAECAKAKCNWCTSAAVPSACYDPADASKLPPSVFKCTS